MKYYKLLKDVDAFRRNIKKILKPVELIGNMDIYVVLIGATVKENQQIIFLTLLFHHTQYKLLKKIERAESRLKKVKSLTTKQKLAYKKAKHKPVAAHKIIQNVNASGERTVRRKYKKRVMLLKK